MPPPPAPQGGEMQPEQILQLGMSFTSSRVLTAAVRLDVFTPLAGGPRTVVETARAVGASERGTRILLDALIGLQLLTRQGEHYQLTPATARYLVRESPDYLGAILEDDSLWQSWANLVDVVRTGKPTRRVESQEGAESFFPVLIRSLHIINREPARRVAQVLGAGSSRRGLRVLDVACGSGVWGIGVAQADPEAHVTMQDFPGVLEHTRRYAEKSSVAARCDYLAGDLKQVDFGTDRYDVALLGNIVHSEGEASSRDLFGRLHRALRPQGQVAIVDMIPNDERTGPPYPLLFAVTMLVSTEVGATYTLAEYRAWLNEAGFRRVEAADIGSHSPLVVGTK